ncbi:hypothetical protein FCV25MIE_26003 [Fagus crenata]
MNPRVLVMDRSQEHYNVLWDNSGQNHHANNNSDQNHHVNPASPMDDNIYQNHYANNNSDQNHHVNPASPMDNYNNYSGLINWIVQVTHVVLGLVTPLVVEQVTPLVVEQVTQLLASYSAVNQVLPLPLNPPPVMPIADYNQNLPCHQSEHHHAYAPFAPQQGVTPLVVEQMTQLLASNSAVNQVLPLPLNPPPVMPIADYNQNLPCHQSEHHHAYAPFAPQQGVTPLVVEQMTQLLASNSAVNQVLPLPLNPPPVMPIADYNQNLPCHQSEHHHAYAPFAPQQGVTEEANGIDHGVPTVPQSDQVHYGGSTGTLEIPSSSRPLKRKSVAQTGESYDQSERDTTQITENINPMYNYSGPINSVAQQMIAPNSAVNQVPPSPLNPPPVMPIADSNQNLPCHQSEHHHAYAPFAPQQGVTEEANGIDHGVPTVPQSDQVHYGGSTGTLEIPSSSRPLKRKSVAQTGESYDQSERDTTQITENINPMYNYSGPINSVAQQMIAPNSAVNQVPPSPLNPPPVMPIADSNQNLPCHQSEHHHAHAPFAPQQGVTEEANGIDHGVPTVPQSDQVHYGGSTGTLEIPSSSRPLKRKSVAQTGESYDQSERDTTQITENINPAAARMPSNTGSSRSCSRKGKEKVPVPRPRKKNSTRKGETRLDSLQQACNASQQIDSSTDAALSIPPNPKPTSYSLTCSSCYKVKKNLIQENTILHGDMALDAGILELVEKILREYNRTIKYKLV